MSALTHPEPVAGSVERARSAYIAGPLYDWAFFLLPPILSVVIGAWVAHSSIRNQTIALGTAKIGIVTIAMGAIVQGHLAAVLVRSHLNPQVFPRHPFRFIVLPIAVFLSMLVSMWAVVIVSVLVVFWDVYHSAAQTFGLSRIYDRNAGNDPTVGRRLDLALNVLLYAGPIVAGATMLTHFKQFERFRAVDALFFAQIPALMTSNQRYFTIALLVGGTAFVAYYVFAYARLARRGYKISLPKVFLLGTTGLCSIWVWGFNPWGQAFLIMNLFHAVQYFAIVWWSERGMLVRRLRLEGSQFGKPIAAILLLAGALSYGVWAEVGAGRDRALWSLTQVVALMHFFYDGFIWSVRRKQV